MKTNLISTLSIALLITTSTVYADEGRLNKLVLKNNTDSAQNIKIHDSKGEKLFDDKVDNDENFIIKGNGENEALGEEIYIDINDEYYTTIKTGCSHVEKDDEIDDFKVKEIKTTPCDSNNDRDDYDEGWDDGYDPGFEEGKDDACEKKTHNIDEEFDDDGIYDKGWKKGYTYGYEKGWKSCDQEEDTSSFDDGWDAGYHPGAEEAQADVNAEKPYHIDEEFSDASHYDEGWEKGYKKGYDYFYGKKTFPKYFKGESADAVTEDKKYAVYHYKKAQYNIISIVKLDDMVEVYYKSYYDRYNFRDLQFIGNDKISYIRSGQANPTTQIISFLEEE